MTTSNENDDKATSVYNADLMSYVSRIDDLGRQIKNPDYTAEAYSPICGSTVAIEITVDKDNKISDIGYEVSACALTKTVMAIVLDRAIDLDLKGLITGSKALDDILEHGHQAEGHWSDLNILIPARDYTARHNSMRLPFDAMIKALS